MAANAQDIASIENAAPGVVVVGNGPVGMHCARTLCELGYARTVTVLGDEPWQPYDRVRLSSFLAREMRHEALFTQQGVSRYPQARVVPRTRVVTIDRDNRKVVDAQGGAWSYSKLVLATGSTPNVPVIPGRELDAVFVFRSMSDAQALLARQLRSRATVVIGGGLLGLEAARAMLRFNTEVHVVEHEPRLMFRQLDESASALLREHVERIGINVHTGTSVQQIFGHYSPSGVRLRNGTEIVCDTVVISAGIRPNVELARDAGLPVGRGIRVDDRMQTSDADIFAVGECCEHRDAVYGLVGPGIEQAAVAATAITGEPADYRGSIASTQLKVVGCNVFSLGEVDDSARPFRSHVFRSEGRYRRINVDRGRIIGAVGFGEWDVSRLRNLALAGGRVWPWQLLSFRRSGELWLNPGTTRVAAWPAAATVCTCRGVSRGQLSEAVAAGAASIEALAECTGASTVCGTCKPLLRNLVGAPAAPLSAGLKTMLVLSLVATVLGLLSLPVALPYVDSLSLQLRWDRLWTDSGYKQASGFSLLGLSLLLAALSLRKRIARFRWARFGSWQLVHVAGGVGALAALLVHTGFRTGANLNAWLMLSFSALLLAGAASGVLTAAAERLAPGSGQAGRSAALWLHILLLWPLPALLGFHILKSYYF